MGGATNCGFYSWGQCMAKLESAATARLINSSFSLGARSAGPTAGSIILLRAEASVPNFYPASVRVARLSEAAPRRTYFRVPVPILWGMLRSRRARLRTLDVPLAARNRALHYLAHEDRPAPIN